MHACGRKEFSLLEQIKKDTYICSLHFIDPIEENPDPVIATSITERQNKKRKAPKVRTPLLKKHIVQDDSMQLNDEVPTVSTANEDENMDFILEGQENRNNKATETVGIGKAIVAAQIETRVVRNMLLAESNINGSSGSSSSSCNRMSFKLIHDDREKCKYFCGLYPEQFDALFTFLGEAKFNQT